MKKSNKHSSPSRSSPPIATKPSTTSDPSTTTQPPSDQSAQCDYRHRIQTKQHLSPSYRLVCDYILTNYIIAAMSTANEVADAVNVDTTVVVRCAQVLGYRGWPELQDQLKAHALAEFAEDQGAGKQNYIDALHAWDRYEACRRAATILPGSERNAKAAATAYRVAREITDYCLR